MTDNEIIKALKCFYGKEVSCKDCAYKTNAFACITNVARDAIDLINRQQAEIERLKAMNQSKLDTIHDLQTEIESLKIENESLRSAAHSYKLHYNEARAEAVKEFAERLKGKIDVVYSIKHLQDNIDNLVKEMVGDTE